MKQPHESTCTWGIMNHVQRQIFFTKTMPLASLPLTKSKCSTFDHTRHELARGAPVAIETHRLYQLEIDDPQAVGFLARGHNGQNIVKDLAGFMPEDSAEFQLQDELDKNIYDGVQ